MVRTVSYNIISGLLFPVSFQLLGYTLLACGLVSVVLNVWVSIVLILTGLLLVTAYSGTEFKNGRYREYNAFYFWKFGDWNAYKEVEKIVIKKAKISQKLYGRANQSSVIMSDLYSAFLLFKDGSKVLLYDSKNKNKLALKVKKANEYLQTEIVDYSV